MIIVIDVDIDIIDVIAIDVIVDVIIDVVDVVDVIVDVDIDIIDVSIIIGVTVDDINAHGRRAALFNAFFTELSLTAPSLWQHS